jgi:glutamyl-tRNA reductase
MSELPDPAVKPEIPLLVVGFDFRIASSALREQLVTTEEERAYMFGAIKRLDDSAGLLVLETCNRLEWIVSTQHPQWIAELLKARMLSKWQDAFPHYKNLPSPYEFREEEAVRHVLRVVVGLESLAMGEAQIAGQFQTALIRAQEEKTSSPIINRLSHVSGRIARSGFKMGFRSNYRQGIHGLTARFLERHFLELDENHSLSHTRDDPENEPIRELDKKQVLVVGMGDIGRRTAALIEETFQCTVERLNRTVKPENRNAWITLDRLTGFSETADALVVATGAPVPIIDNDILSVADREKPLLIMDIGIPRQVAEPVHSNPDVIYRNIDHLMDVGGSAGQCACIDKLKKEIEKEFLRFKQFCRGREMSDLLSRIHSGRLELTENRIPDFVGSHLSDLEPLRRKKIEKAMKQFIKDYSNEIFFAFHDTMEKYWSAYNNETE